MSHKRKVCFVVPYIYPLFNPDIKTMFGGWEVRIATIAREIIRNANYEVSIIVADHGQPHREIREGIEFISWKGKQFYGIPVQELSDTAVEPGIDPLPISDNPVVARTPTPSSDMLIENEITPENETNIAKNQNKGANPSNIDETSNISTDLGDRNKEDETGQIAASKETEVLLVAQKTPREKLKKVYKSIVPWKIRIVMTGLASGTRVSINNLIDNWRHAGKFGILGVRSSITTFISGFISSLKTSVRNLLENWNHAVRLIVWGIRSSFRMLRDHVQPAINNARNALGNIADLPVFPDQMRIYAEADADIYVVPGNNRISAEVAFFSKKEKRAYIMLAGSDIDFSPEFLLNPGGHDIYHEPYSVKLFTIQNADVHLVQNQRQMELAKRYRVSPIMIRNPMDLERKFIKAENSRFILWIGNTDERVKRPSVLVEIARRLPEYTFLMIITPAVQEIYERLCDQARNLPNLEIISRVPFHQIEKYFAKARLFVNTSSFEGFPNTFLQAGKYGIPVVSLKVDPNSFFSEHGCGFVCHDDSEVLITHIKMMMSNSEIYEKTSKQIFDYVLKYHDKDKIVPQIEEQIRAVLARKR